MFPGHFVFRSGNEVHLLYTRLLVKRMNEISLKIKQKAAPSFAYVHAACPVRFVKLAPTCFVNIDPVITDKPLYMDEIFGDKFCLVNIKTRSSQYVL